MPFAPVPAGSIAPIIPGSITAIIDRRAAEQAKQAKEEI